MLENQLVIEKKSNRKKILEDFKKNEKKWVIDLGNRIKNIFSIKLPSIYTKNIRTIENKIGSIEKQIENSNSYFEKAYLETEKYKYEVRKIQEMTKILIDYSVKNKDFLEKKLEDYKRDYFKNRYEYYKLNREVD